MRYFLLFFAVVQVGTAETPWWERQADRFVHVEGWSVPAPAGWKSAIEGDMLRLSDAHHTLMLAVADSQAEVETELTPVYGYMRQQNGGKLPAAQRFSGRNGLLFVRRTAALADRRVSIVHVLRPGLPQAHLVVFYQVENGSLPEPIEDVLREVEYLRRL